MCGIVGYLDKTGNPDHPTGDILYRMLSALSRRGPDSAGVALLGKPHEDRLLLRLKLGEQGNLEARGQAVLAEVNKRVPVRKHQLFSEYLRLVVDPVEDIQAAHPAGGDGRRRAGAGQPGKPAGDRQAGGLAGESARALPHPRLDRHSRHRTHPHVHREPCRPEPLPALLGPRSP